LFKEGRALRNNPVGYFSGRSQIVAPGEGLRKKKGEGRGGVKNKEKG